MECDEEERVLDEGHTRTLDEEAYTQTFDFAMLAQDGTAASDNIAELYDSGASQHMSPFSDHFVNLISIPPKPITAADKRTFNAVGCGDYHLEIPNGKERRRILLKNVLYAPSMGVTLVS